MTAKLEGTGVSGPRQEILRLLAEGRITPSEAEALIDALEEGLSAQTGAGDPPVRRSRAAKPERARSSSGDSQATGVASRGRPKSVRPASPTDTPSRRATRAASPADTPSRRATRPAPPAEGPRHRPSEPTPPADRPEETPSAGAQGLAPAGRLWDVPPESTLRIGPPMAGSGAPSGLGIRGVDGNRVQIYRGAGAELRATEGGACELVWDEGILIVDIPASLRGLEIAGINGKVTLLHYSGPFAIENVAGSLAVGLVRSPFRIRKVGGDVELDALSLQGGLSTVADVAGDVRVLATRDASFSVRASSLSGQVAFGRTIAVDSGDPSRRRGVWRLGSGAGQLNITGVKGWIRLFQDPDDPEGQ